MTQSILEGWHTDPWGLHDARWLSGGAPTKLVRDGSVERFDDVPSSVATSTPTPIAVSDGASHGVDLRRSDQETFDPRQAMAIAATKILTRFSD